MHKLIDLLQSCKFYVLLILFTYISILNAQEQETEPSVLPLTLKEAILKNLLQQPAIRVSLFNIDIQKGITQSSAAPFDATVNSSVNHTDSYDLLNLGQSLTLNPNLNPCANTTTTNATTTNTTTPTTTQNNTATTPCNPCPTSHTRLQAHETTVHVDVAKRFRNGTRIAFNLDVDQTNNPINCPQRLNMGKVGVEIDQPLLRGRSYGLDRMTELANRQQIYVVRYNTLQTISIQVLNTISLYWDTVEAKRNITIQVESEERLKKVVDDVNYLIAHGQMAQADIMQPLAQLSTQIVNRISAEQTYFAIEQRLKFAMGEWDETCPCCTKSFEVVDDFPSSSLIATSLPSIFCRLFPTVYHQRFDIMASSMLEGVYVLLLKGAENFKLPQLDIVGRATVSDFTVGSQSRPLFSSLDFEHPQKDLTIGIVFSTPFCQDEAKGLIRQRQGQWAQTQAQTQLLKQQALADISEALRNQMALQEELKKAKDAVEEYQKLLENEAIKLKAGYSTIFILLDFETSLTQAEVTYLHLQNLIAKNIATLRFLTGTLITPSPMSDCRSFLVEEVTSLPFHTEKTVDADKKIEPHVDIGKKEDKKISCIAPQKNIQKKL